MGDFATLWRHVVAQRSVALADLDLAQMSREEGGEVVGRQPSTLARPLVALARDDLQLVEDAARGRPGSQRLGAAWEMTWSSAPWTIIRGGIFPARASSAIWPGMTADSRPMAPKPGLSSGPKGPPPIWAKPTASPPRE